MAMPSAATSLNGKYVVGVLRGSDLRFAPPRCPKPEAGHARPTFRIILEGRDRSLFGVPGLSGWGEPFNQAVSAVQHRLPPYRGLGSSCLSHRATPCPSMRYLVQRPRRPCV